MSCKRVALFAAGMTVLAGCDSPPPPGPAPAPVSSVDASEVFRPVVVNGVQVYGLSSVCDPPRGARIYKYSTGPGNPSIAVMPDNCTGEPR